MRITNKHNLPAPLVRAAENDPYDRGNARWSVTQLVAPVQLVTLMDRYGDELEVDVIDRLYAMEGQALHVLFERAAANVPGVEPEERLYAEVIVCMPREGMREEDGNRPVRVTVSGQLDVYDAGSNTLAHLEGGVLQDYKWTSANTAHLHRGDWEQQLNLLAELLRRNGRGVRALEVVALYRDWTAHKRQGDPSYPRQRVEVIPLAIWPADAAAAVLKAKVRALVEASQLPDERLRECSPDERWARGRAQWAVVKPGASRAHRVLDQCAAANVEALKIGGKVEMRTPEPVRCTGGLAGTPYCPVAAVCQQLKRERRR